MVRKQQKVKRSGLRWNGDRFKHKSLLAKRELDMTILPRMTRHYSAIPYEPRSALHNSHVYLHIDREELTDEQGFWRKPPKQLVSEPTLARHVKSRQMTSELDDERRRNSSNE